MQLSFLVTLTVVILLDNSLKLCAHAFKGDPGDNDGFGSQKCLKCWWQKNREHSSEYIG